MFALSRRMNEAVKGDWKTPLRLRHTDYLHELKDELNTALSQRADRWRQDLSALSEASLTLEGAIVELKEGLDMRERSKLDQIEQTTNEMIRLLKRQAS